MASSKSTRQETDLLTREDSNSSLADLDHELRAQQERLLELQKQQEEVERRKQRLESLNQQRMKVASGQKHLREKFSDALALLERSEFDLQRQAEYIESTQKEFAEHLERIEGIDPSAWDPEEIDEELTKSLRIIDVANADYEKFHPKLDVLSKKELGETTSNSVVNGMGSQEYDASGDMLFADDLPFVELVRRGFGLSFPLIVVLTLISLVYFFKP
ncbi:MAG: hypothetical protein AAGA18_09015 [Verrucomicrobiota bacterium]